MKNEYNQHPTLLIGLGGIGSQVADNIYGTVKNQYNVLAYCIDTDMYTGKMFEHISPDNFIDFHPHLRLKDNIAILPGAKNWFPSTLRIIPSDYPEFLGPVRSIARLAYEVSLQRNSYDKLYDTIYQMAQTCTSKNCGLNISIITSLCGGTGAGIFIQAALMLRNYLSQTFPELSVKIYGEFILPSYFDFVSSDVEKCYMEAITYASLKELYAINEYFFCNGPAIELNYFKNQQTPYVNSLAYDYCFLHEKTDSTDSLTDKQIETSIVEHLFGESSITINKVFCPVAEFKNIERLKYPSGQYYRSYKKIVERIPQTVTPHLNSKWHQMLNDIGYEP